MQLFLTIWDLTKGVDPNLSIHDVRLLVKTGGKNGVWKNPMGVPGWLEQQLPNSKFLNNINVAVLVMSDRASKGEYADQSGLLLKELINAAGAKICSYDVIPDDESVIISTILSIQNNKKPDLLITSGGTGPGPRDVTPDVLSQISSRMLDGLGDLFAGREPKFYRYCMVITYNCINDRPNVNNRFPWFPKSCSRMLGYYFTIHRRCSWQN